MSTPPPPDMGRVSSAVELALVAFAGLVIGCLMCGGAFNMVIDAIAHAIP